MLTAEEYLSTSYEHDPEFVDGVLVERGMPTYEHGLLQTLLNVWFSAFEKRFGFRTILGTRIQIVDGKRYRVPDVMLVAPQPRGTRVVEVVPFAVFEILSPDDRLSAQTARYKEFWSKGVREIVILNPETCSAWRWQENTLIQGEIEVLRLPDGREVPFRSTDLFQQFLEQFEP